MGWAIIRRATLEDRERLEQAAIRFCKRHNLKPVVTPGISLGNAAVTEAFFQTSDNAYLRKLWRACARRALQSKSAEGIAYDSVGYNTSS